MNKRLAVIPPELRGVLVADPDYLSGAVRFCGTRVPVQALLDCLQANHSVEYFLEGFPDVAKDQADAVVRWQQTSARAVFGLEQVA